MDYAEIIIINKNVIVKGINHLDLGETLNCGQAFRWKEISPFVYSGFAGKEFCTVEKAGEDLIFHNVSKDTFYSHWYDYFDLGRDYGKIKKILSQDKVLKNAMEFAPGIRILKQDSWEALCSFIISANNNIKRITGIIDKLCENFGDKTEFGFAFPSPKTLSTLTIEDLSVIRSGFRAKYIIDAAQKVASGEIKLQEITLMPLDEARVELQKIKGVGPKVAECALLFGFERCECVPMDVWMKRVMSILYPDGFDDFILPIAGIAQQYLFHYVRNNPEILEQTV